MKLWEKGTKTASTVESFTAGMDRQLDLMLAEADIEGTMAHAAMLETIGLLERDELISIRRELAGLLETVHAGNFIIEEGVEDVHSQLELLLTRSLGDTGKRIHAGRSRNDQVLTDLKLFFRAQLREIVGQVRSLTLVMLQLSEEHQYKGLPGYTHFQVAMPSSFGLWFGAYAESLVDDLEAVRLAFSMANKNPLGSAAGYGSSLPINRTLTTTLLGFDDLHHNVVYAQMSRGKTERLVAQAIAAVAATLNKMAADVCIYMSQDLGFITLPDEYTTGSSIMPHKKNPDVFELIRGRCNQLMALPNQIIMLTNNLPSGYHRDFQLLKEILFPAFGILHDCLALATEILPRMLIRTDILEAEKYKYLFSVDAVNQLLTKGMPFRDAYRQVATEISAGVFIPEMSQVHTHEGSIGNLHNEYILANLESRIESFPFHKIDQAITELFLLL